MRQWNVNPKLMCRQHLLGEHHEMHMFLGIMRRGKKIDGYITNGLIEAHSVKERHDELVMEMVQRGYNHATPFPVIDFGEMGRVDTSENLFELYSRCKDCRKLMNGDYDGKN